MRNLFCFLVIFIAVGGVVFAEDSNLNALETADDIRGWEAVGRLNIDGTSFCTGSLIASDIVLTAAHCLFDNETGVRVEDSSINFQAGWRNGQSAASRRVKFSVIHESYDNNLPGGQARVRNDIALLKLESRIRDGRIVPFATDDRPGKGADVAVVSYARDRISEPALQKSCSVLARQLGTLVLSCDVDFGSSGAPVFVLENGEARIVSVISAKAQMQGKNVSLGTSLETPLADLKVDLEEGQSGQGAGRLGQRNVLQSGTARENSAKFLKP